MKVIKEAWVLQDINDENVFKCMQNTTTPKLYASKTSATKEAKYQEHNQICKYQTVKAFLVIEQDELPF